MKHLRALPFGSLAGTSGSIWPVPSVSAVGSIWPVPSVSAVGLLVGSEPADM